MKNAFYFTLKTLFVLKIFGFLSWLFDHLKNVNEKLYPDSFLKNQYWTYFWINSLKFYTVCFYCMLIWGQLKFSEIKLQTICFYLMKTLFKKKKRGLELVSLPHFLYDFWRKMFLLLYSINWPNFIFWMPLIREILSDMGIATVC